MGPACVPGQDLMTWRTVHTDHTRPTLGGMDPTDIIFVDNLRRHDRTASRALFEAVCGVTFSVRRGELFALLGTNGAGTSTLEVLEGLALPSSGTVKVLGRDPARERRVVRPRTGVMLQEGGLPAGLTVAETTRMWAGTLTAARPVSEPGGSGLAAGVPGAAAGNGPA